MTGRRPVRTTASLAAVVLLVALTAAVDAMSGPGPTAGASAAAPAPGTGPEATARAFLDAHVSPEGRVVRTDQGGDTVSEGQAWALLVATALEDEARATAIVAWTEAHLARDDGLLAWHWADGAVVDAQPASDADLVYAWALARGATQFGRPSWQARADEVVDALASTSVVPTPDGPLLTAGPWAVGADDVAIVNPSYLWPTALRWAEERHPRLAGTTGAAVALVRRLVTDDTPLVPDWVQVRGDGSVRAIGPPTAPDEPPRHGFDALRTWIWFAADCHPEVRALAAAPRGAFATASRELVAVHDLAGEGVVEWQHPATLAGAAAVAYAADDRGRARDRLRAAAELQREQPTYYGAAVLSLARLALETDTLGGCPVSG